MDSSAFKAPVQKQSLAEADYPIVVIKSVHEFLQCMKLLLSYSSVVTALVFSRGQYCSECAESMSRRFSKEEEEEEEDEEEGGGGGEDDHDDIDDYCCRAQRKIKHSEKNQTTPACSFSCKRDILVLQSANNSATSVTQCNLDSRSVHVIDPSTSANGRALRRALLEHCGRRRGGAAEARRRRRRTQQPKPQPKPSEIRGDELPIMSFRFNAAEVCESLNARVRTMSSDDLRTTVMTIRPVPWAEHAVENAESASYMDSPLFRHKIRQSKTQKKKPGDDLINAVKLNAKTCLVKNQTSPCFRYGAASYSDDTLREHHFELIDAFPISKFKSGAAGSRTFPANCSSFLPFSPVRSKRRSRKRSDEEKDLQERLPKQQKLFHCTAEAAAAAVKQRQQQQQQNKVKKGQPDYEEGDEEEEEEEEDEEEEVQFQQEREQGKEQEDEADFGVDSPESLQKLYSYRKLKLANCLRILRKKSKKWSVMNEAATAVKVMPVSEGLKSKRSAVAASGVVFSYDSAGAAPHWKMRQHSTFEALRPRSHSTTTTTTSTTTTTTSNSASSSSSSPSSSSSSSSGAPGSPPPPAPLARDSHSTTASGASPSATAPPSQDAEQKKFSGSPKIEFALHTAFYTTEYSAAPAALSVGHNHLHFGYSEVCLGLLGVHASWKNTHVNPLLSTYAADWSTGHHHHSSSSGAGASPSTNDLRRRYFKKHHNENLLKRILSINAEQEHYTVLTCGLQKPLHNQHSRRARASLQAFHNCTSASSSGSYRVAMETARKDTLRSERQAFRTFCEEVAIRSCLMTDLGFSRLVAQSTLENLTFVLPMHADAVCTVVDSFEGGEEPDFEMFGLKWSVPPASPPHSSFRKQAPANDYSFFSWKFDKLRLSAPRCSRFQNCTDKDMRIALDRTEMARMLRDVSLISQDVLLGFDTRSKSLVLYGCGESGDVLFRLPHRSRSLTAGERNKALAAVRFKSKAVASTSSFAVGYHQPLRRLYRFVHTPDYIYSAREPLVWFCRVSLRELHGMVFWSKNPLMTVCPSSSTFSQTDSAHFVPSSSAPPGYDRVELADVSLPQIVAIPQQPTPPPSPPKQAKEQEQEQEQAKEQKQEQEQQQQQQRCEPETCYGNVYCGLPDTQCARKASLHPNAPDVLYMHLGIGKPIVLARHASTGVATYLHAKSLPTTLRHLSACAKRVDYLSGCSKRLYGVVSWEKRSELLADHPALANTARSDNDLQTSTYYYDHDLRLTGGGEVAEWVR